MDNVNIASMNVARAPKTSVSKTVLDSLAMTFISVDDDVSTHAMKSLKSLSFLHNVAKVQLR
jgi:hypothetical protein